MIFKRILSVLLVCVLVLGALETVAWKSSRFTRRWSRTLQLSGCQGNPCDNDIECRSADTDLCGVGPDFCNTRSLWNSTGCQELEIPAIPVDPFDNETNTGGSDDAGAAVGGVIGTLAVIVGAVVGRKKYVTYQARKIPDTPWTLEETAALQRAYEFTKDFDSLCKAVPSKTPAQIAIKLKKLLAPKTMFERASMMLFSATRGSFGMAPPPQPKFTDKLATIPSAFSSAVKNIQWPRKNPFQRKNMPSMMTFNNITWPNAGLNIWRASSAPTGPATGTGPVGPLGLPTQMSSPYSGGGYVPPSPMMGSSSSRSLSQSPPYQSSGSFNSSFRGNSYQASNSFSESSPSFQGGGVPFQQQQQFQGRTPFQQPFSPSPSPGGSASKYQGNGMMLNPPPLPGGSASKYQNNGMMLNPPLNYASDSFAQSDNPLFNQSRRY